MLYMIAQNVNGKRTSTLYLECGADDLTAVTSLLEGSYEVYSSSINGGTDSLLPAHFNKVSFKVDKPVTRNGRKVSCGQSFTIPHFNPAKSIDTAMTSFVGKFDKNFVSAEACTTAKLISQQFVTE